MKIYNRLIIFTATVVLAWGIPLLFRLATEQATRTPFTYYSSVNKVFCQLIVGNDSLIRVDKTGKHYSESEFDSILPMFYYRQLLAEDRMPDTLFNYPMNMRFIRSQSFMFRYKPNTKFTPSVKLFPLLESIPKRLSYELPDDVFRVNDGMEFIDIETNTIDAEKSQKYTSILKDKGFAGPARLVAGNATTRKMYDNGYFIVDNNYEVYHVRQMNNKPFIKKTSIPAELEVKHIAVTEYASRQFYGFLWDKDNKMYLINTLDYKLIPIPIPPFTLEEDDLVIMANPFFWNINIINKKGKTTWAINRSTNEKVDEIVFKHTEARYPALAEWLFPFVIKYHASTDKYLIPRFSWNLLKALPLNIVFVLLLLAIDVRKKRKKEVLNYIWVALTGIFGFVTTLIFQNRQK